jgi:hypothetical protein
MSFRTSRFRKAALAVPVGFALVGGLSGCASMIPESQGTDGTTTAPPMNFGGMFGGGRVDQTHRQIQYDASRQTVTLTLSGDQSGQVVCGPGQQVTADTMIQGQAGPVFEVIRYNGFELTYRKRTPQGQLTYGMPQGNTLSPTVPVLALQRGQVGYLRQTSTGDQFVPQAEPMMVNALKTQVNAYVARCNGLQATASRIAHGLSARGGGSFVGDYLPGNPPHVTNIQPLGQDPRGLRRPDPRGNSWGNPAYPRY